MNELSQLPSDTNPTVKPLKQTIIEQLIHLAVLGLVGVVCLYIGRYLERERPQLEIAKIYLSGSRPPKSIIHPFLDIRTTANDLPFPAKDLKKHSLPLEKWISVYDRLGAEMSALKSCRPKVDEIVGILKSRSSDYSKDDLRKELLSLHSKTPGNLLHTTIRSVFYMDDYYKTLIKKWPKYQEHLTEWKDPDKGYVHVSSVRAMNLSEIKISPEDEPQKILEKTLDNISRRLWIYLDREVLLEVFEKVTRRIEQIERRVGDFLKLMDQERELFDPKRIQVKVLMSNSGGRPAVFDSTGMLKLEINDRTIPIEVHGYIRHKLDPKGFFWVQGNAVSVATFFSKDTLNDIESEYFPEIETLYKTSILKATLSLSKITPEPEPEIMTTVRKAVFGQESARLFPELKQ